MRVLYVLGLVLVGVVLVLGLAVAAVSAGGAPLIVALIENQGTALLGRQIRLGQLEVTWGRPIHIVALDFSVANAAWGSSPDMFSGRRLDMELDPAAWLRLKLRIPHLVLEDATMVFETSTEGRANWEPSMLNGRNGMPEVQSLLIRKGAFRYRNGQTAATTEVAIDDLVAEASDQVSPIQLKANGVFERQAFVLSGELARLAQLENASEPYPVKLEGYLGANKVALRGVIAEAFSKQRLDLRVELNGQDIQQLLATLGVPFPKMPIYHLAGRMHREAQQWRFEDVTGRIGDSQLAGRILVDTGQQVPYIQAQLTSTYLDLADLKGFYGGDPNRPPTSTEEKTRDGQVTGKSGRVIPDLRLPTGKLLGFNADLSLDAPNVKPTAGLPFEHVTFGVSLRDGTLRLNPVRVALARGELVGDLEYFSAATPPRFRADIDMSHIDLAKLFGRAEVSDSLRQTAGIAGGFAKLRSAGTKQREILSRLDGDVGLFVQGGKLAENMAGVFESNLAEALGLAAKDGAPHIVDCLIARLDVASGVATAETLMLDTAETVVVGRGNVNIGGETFFLDVKPYAKDRSTRRVGIPFALRGTFADPSLAPDKAGIIARLGAAVGLETDAPPDALLPLIEAGLGKENTCGAALATQYPVASGSSTRHAK
jgi:AsmA family protein